MSLVRGADNHIFAGEESPLAFPPHRWDSILTHFLSL